MGTRISFSSMNARVLDRLYQNYNKLEGIQQQLASGKKVDRASDDPVAVSNSMELRTQINQFNSFQRNVDDGLAYLGTVDTTLSTGNGLYQNMRERAIQASNDTNSAESRFFIGREVRGMFDQMIALANTSFKGEYIFAGNNTQTPPYALRTGQATFGTAAPVGGIGQLVAGDIGTPNATKQINDLLATDSTFTSGYTEAGLIVPGTLSIAGLAEGTDYDVNYVDGTITFLTANSAAQAALAGGIVINFDWLRRSEEDMDGVVNREIEEGVTARLNSTASDVFGSPQESTAWEAMINLLEGTLLNKADKVRDSVGQIDAALSRSLSTQATNGSRVLRFESTQTRNDERIVYSTQLQSDVEDVDFAAAVSQFTLQQAVYEASLKMGARAIQNTLVNFL
jgi:flagellar hook-associated protein 3 FlgL